MKTSWIRTSFIFLLLFETQTGALAAESSPPTCTAEQPCQAESKPITPTAVPALPPLYGKEWGKCWLAENQRSQYLSTWTKYRIATKVRYSILVKSLFKKKLEGLRQKQAAPATLDDMDLDMQLLVLEADAIDGTNEAEKQKALENEFAAVLKSEKLDSVKNVFELKEDPKSLADYLKILDEHLVPPYNRQDGYELFFLKPWTAQFAQSTSVAYPVGDKTVNLNADDLRAIDATARTLWAETRECQEKDKYQKLAQWLLSQLTEAKTKTYLLNPAIAYPSMRDVERLVSRRGQFSNWDGGSFGSFLVTTGANEKLEFTKMLYPNQRLIDTLCPIKESTKESAKEEDISGIKEAYDVAVQFFFDTPDTKKWKLQKNQKTLRLCKSTFTR